MICICKEGGEEKLKNLKNILNYIVLITVLFTELWEKLNVPKLRYMTVISLK